MNIKLAFIREGNFTNFAIVVHDAFCQKGHTNKKNFEEINFLGRHDLE